MRRSLLVLLLMVLFWSGCSRQKPVVVRSEGRAPIGSATTALSPQAREVPWSGQTLRAAAPFELRAHSGLDAPMGAIELRLRARQAALGDLARQLSRLPAAEPPPGESIQSNIADFAGRQPQFARLVEEQLQQASEEIRLVPGEQRGQVEFTLPLGEIADQLLKLGGGFRRGDQLAEAIGPRGIAARRANDQAEDQLLRSVLATPITPELTVEQWLRLDPLNRRRLVEVMETKKTLTGEARPRTDGEQGEEFVVEYEVDLTPLIKRARAIEKERERARRAAAREAARQ